MNKMILVMAMIVSTNAFSMDAVNCAFFEDGMRVEEVETFDILNVNTKNPDATIDGGLLDFSRDAISTSMSFSNECDNMYAIEFLNSDLKNAKNGKVKLLKGTAVISVAREEENIDVKGTITCEIRK